MNTDRESLSEGTTPLPVSPVGSGNLLTSVEGVHTGSVDLSAHDAGAPSATLNRAKFEADKTSMYAIQFSVAALVALEAHEAEYGPIPDDHEFGRIPESAGSASFRIRAGHIRLLNKAIGERPELNRAWADINALGGAPSTPEEEAYGRALDDCMAILERLGATDKTWLAEFKTPAQAEAVAK